MAESTSVITNALPKVSTAGILNGILITLVVIIAIGIIAYLFWYYTKKKKYGQFRIEILDKDSNGNVYKTYDRGGVFLDKTTGLKLLYIEKAKVGLDPNNPPYVSHKDKKGRLVKTIYLRRIGVNNYVYVDVKLGKSVEITVGEEDLNNAHSEMHKIRRIYNKESWISKYAPYITFIITIMIVMIILISLFNKFAVIKDVSDNLLKISETQLQITGQLRNLTMSPTINSNMPIIVGQGVIK